MNFRRRVIAVIVAGMLLTDGGTVIADVLNMPSYTSLTFVTVSDENNLADTEVRDDNTTGYGSVAYTYKIGTYEVTNAQYCEFLNSVGGTDTYELYATTMDGISQGGLPGSHTYALVPGLENNPVRSVSFWGACRFTNWLHNGQPSGLQDATTTEDGSYTLNGYNGPDGGNIKHKQDARFWVPTENEWYKAAYYDPNKPGGAGYWDYPTQSDVPPTAEPPPGTDLVNGSATYAAVLGPCPVGSYNTTLNGDYVSDSAYGTFDQGGNRREWSETTIGGFSRGQFGGHYNDAVWVLHASYRSNGGHPYNNDPLMTFRVAMVPEPATLWLLTLGGLFPMRSGLRRRR